MRHHQFGEGKEGNDVGNDHQVIEHIRQLPHQVVAHHGAQQDKHQRNGGIHRGAGLGIFLSEEPDGVDFAEEVPAQHRGEGEEEQADSHKLGTEAHSHDGAEGGLGQIGLAENGGHIPHVSVGQWAVCGVKGADNHQCIEGQHHEGVNEHANHGHHPLLVGVLHVGLCVSMGGGAHTGLVGEQPPLGTLRDGLLDGKAEGAAYDGLRRKGIFENHGEGGRHIADAANQHKQTAQQENGRHNRHDFLRHGSQTLDAPQENHAADDHQHDAHNPGGDAESGLEALADGVGLHHAAHEAQCQNDGHGEEGGQEPAEAALEGSGDVIDGAAVDGAVLRLYPGFNSQHRLRVNGGHAEEGDNPHPEDGTGAAGEDGAGSAYDIAGAHLRGDGRCQRLKRTHAAVVLFAPEGQIPEHPAHSLSEAAHLHKAGFDAVPQTHTHQQEHQNVVGEIGVHIAHNGIKGCVQF